MHHISRCLGEAVAQKLLARVEESKEKEKILNGMFWYGIFHDIYTKVVRTFLSGNHIRKEMINLTCLTVSF